jgi:sarcosine oxidase subunit beta
MDNHYDVIVIGAGSVGVPLALFLTLQKQKVLVLEAEASIGQGQNKAAIGGVRATHSDQAKILTCQESLRIFGAWKETWGRDISWKKGGYCFPVLGTREETIVKNLLPIQKSFGLNIDWLDAEGIREIIPGITTQGLLGGVYSPDDGQVSPLHAIEEMFRVAVAKGCTFQCKEPVSDILSERDNVYGVRTEKNTYHAGAVVIAAGAHAARAGAMAGIDIPVIPDSHEAGISAPVEQFLGPLVVDLRPGADGKTSNFYFGQNHEGCLIFCYTPKQLFIGTNREPTSEFLPVLAQRMIQLLPRLKNILVRRVWRGLYPMSPDGLPICGKVPGKKGLYVAVGMCGQGFMMGPGIGINMAKLIADGRPLMASSIFDTFRCDRDYGGKKEALK